MKKEEPDSILRGSLLELLRGGGAHLTFDDAVRDLPAALRGGKPAGQPHTPWRLVEHMRITQSDILEFVRDPKHESPDWPDDYWPQGDAPPNARAWDKCLAAFRADRKAIEKLISDPKCNLLARLPHGQGQTIAREVMLVADHTAYHLGQLMIVRRELGAWE